MRDLTINEVYAVSGAAMNPDSELSDGAMAAGIAGGVVGAEVGGSIGFAMGGPVGGAAGIVVGGAAMGLVAAHAYNDMYNESSK